MLKKEFEKLIGRAATDDEYVNANAMYMEAGDDINKEMFCADYKKFKDSLLLQIFWESYRQEKKRRIKEEEEAKSLMHCMQETIAKKQQEVESLREELDEQQDANRQLIHSIGTFLIDEYALTASKIIRDKAIEILGEKTYLKLLLTSGAPLKDDDYRLLVSTIGRDTLADQIND